MHRRRISLSLLLSVSILSSAGFSLAQQGDRKGHKMVDPIPTDKIPPSPYLNLQDALKSFKIADGYVIEPVAAGAQTHMPVAVSFDANGRAWTAEMRSYMPDLDGNGEDRPDGTIRILEDTDGDGKTDKSTIFIDGLVLPRAVAVTSDGCLYTSGDVLYFTKREGFKPVGKPIIVDKEYARGGNVEHKSNGLVYGHDNWYYNAKSAARYRRINGEWKKEKTDFRGQWGIAKDNWGRLFYNSNSTTLQGEQFSPQFFWGNPNYRPKSRSSHRVGSNATHPIRITPGVNRAYMKGTLDSEGKLANVTAACGPHIYRGDNFPTSAQGMGFVCEPGGELIKAVQVDRDEWNIPKGSHPYGEGEFLATTDEWFLPCNIYTAPDGTMWVVDMYFGLLQHKTYMTTYLRKQYASRGLDKPEASNGRIYRIRYAKNAPSAVPKLEGLSPAKLVSFLAHKNGTVRDTAQRLIVESGDKSVEPALAKLVANTDNPLAQVHAIWTLDGLGIYNTSALADALRSKHHGVINNALDILSIHRKAQEFEKKILNMINVSEKRTLHALVRAMAANGMESQALAVVEKNNKVSNLSETFVSGLGAGAKNFLASSPSIKDKNLAKHLKASASKSNAKPVPEAAHLKGAELASFKRGKELYTTRAACFGCHGGDGAGLDNLGPPLAPSEWVTKNPDTLAKILLHGMTGPVHVNGKRYAPPAVMPGIKDNPSLKDKDIADVMTYVRNAWGNKAPIVSAEQIKKVRNATKDRATPYTEKDFN